MKRSPRYRGKAYSYSVFAQWLSLSLGILTFIIIANKINKQAANLFLSTDASRQIAINTPTVFSISPLVPPIHRIPKASEISGSGLSQVNFEKIDFDGKHIPYTGTSVRRLAAILSQRATTEQDKARITYVWITHNIRYDVQTFLTKNYRIVSAEDVLRDRQAICSGYATLYESLTRAMGLETVTITGRAKGIDYGIEETSDSNHAWNATKINGIWYLIDTTWGAGILDGDVFRPEFNPFYFAPEPAHIIYSHFPEIPEWQLLPQKITREAFEKFPLLKPHFFDQKLELVEPKDYTISLKHFDEITLRAPLEVDVVATYQPIHQSSNQQKDLKVLRSQRDVKIPLIDMGTDYQVNIFSQYKSQYKDIQQPYELAAIFQVRSQ
ncbi:hypothetical protein L5470_01335 [Synechococcus sp. PCC 6717]|nr:hypothetical protein [Synechococcus sp. PCC 6717]